MNIIGKYVAKINEVLINSELLEDYIRKNYPKFKIISSTTKGLNQNQLNKF